MNLLRRIKPLTIILWTLSITSILLALKTSDEPVLDVFRNTRVESLFQRLPTGNTMLFNFSVGFLVSMIFYLLIVWFPDRRRKDIMKKNLGEQYQSFKVETIQILLTACGTMHKQNLRKQLTELVEFRNYFNERVNESQVRWDIVMGGLDDRLLKDLLVEFEVLLREVTYVRNNVNIENPNVFSFFQRLSQAVYRMKNTTLEYEEKKLLLRFFWELFAGWSFIDGYREDDIVSVMIESI